MSELAGLDLPQKHTDATQRLVAELTRLLAGNLYSVVIYGSAVRGGFSAATSDINLLIVLEVSTPEAHEVIADAIGMSPVLIEPFVLTRAGMERSFRAFAPKFGSVKRHYLVLAGEDPLRDYEADKELAAFLCEQAIRNLRLRAVQAYIHHRRDPVQYLSYLERSLPVVFTDLSEVLRLQDLEVPGGFAERVPVIASQYGVSEDGLAELLKVSAGSHRLSPAEIGDIHRFLYRLLDLAVSRVSAL